MMNLYDKDDGFKRFTLEEANEFLPKVAKVTEKAVKSLAEFKKEYELMKPVDQKAAQKRLEIDSARVLERWSQKIVALGVYPKGYFTVDFKSPIPDTLFCWSYGEETILNTHKIYESFKDRIPMGDQPTLGFEQSLN